MKGFSLVETLIGVGLLIFILMQLSDGLSERFDKFTSLKPARENSSPRANCIGTDKRDCFDTYEGIDFNE